MNADDEVNITDIELMPDGRIYVFGTSLEVLDVLDALQGGQDDIVSRRIAAQQIAVAAVATRANRIGETA